LFEELVLCVWRVVLEEEVEELEDLWEWVVVLCEGDGSVACDGSGEEFDGVSEVFDVPSTVNEFGYRWGGSAECGGDPLGLVGVGSEREEEDGGDLWTRTHTLALSHAEKREKERETHTLALSHTEKREKERETHTLRKKERDRPVERMRWGG
jgi:hypothetical protein